MQEERVAGFKEFVHDVRQGAFPAPKHVIKAPGNLISDFIEAAEADG